MNAIIEAGAYTVLDTLLTVEDERNYIATLAERGVFNVGVEGSHGRIVGLQSVEPFASCTRAFAHVGSIGTFVELSVRRQGLGTRLSETTFQDARRAGYEKVFTYVCADNPGSLAFQLKLGFRIVGTAEKHAKLRGRYVDEIVIERFL